MLWRLQLYVALFSQLRLPKNLEIFNSIGCEPKVVQLSKEVAGWCRSKVPMCLCVGIGPRIGLTS